MLASFFIFIAAFLLTLLDKATIGVEQNKPIFTPGVANLELLDEIARSHEAISWHPAAVATPLTSAIIGLGLLTSKLSRLFNYHVEVNEHDDDIIFLRKIIEGPGDKSYGIQVAKMAGLPSSVIERAREILFHKFENNDEIIQHLDEKHDVKTKNKEDDSIQLKIELEKLLKV